MRAGQRYLAWISAGVLLAAVAVWALSRRTDPMSRLVAAAPRDGRFIEARLSGGFAWAPLRGKKRGGSDAHTFPPLAGADGADPHVVAVAQLFADDASSAIEQLTALAKDSDSASVWSDLSAALLESSSRSGSADRLRDALSAADQALLLDPSFAEARFNRAMILERFSLRDAAADAWRDFLAVASDDGWRGEARAHLTMLTAPQRTFSSEIESRYARLQAGDRAAARDLIRLEPGDARSFGETEGLARWGNAWLRHDVRDADRHLAAVRTLSSELVAFNDETLLRDAVAAIDRAGPEQRDALARGQVAYREGRLAFDRSDMAVAEKTLKTAARELESARSPLAVNAWTSANVVVLWQGRHDEAEHAFRELLAKVPAEHSALHAYVEWQLASCLFQRAETADSLLYYDRAIDTYDRLRERTTAAYLHDIVAQMYDGIRDRDRAATHRTLALRELGKTANAKLWHVLIGLVNDALQQKEWRAARSFLNLQIPLIKTVHNTEYAVTAVLRRARVHAQLGDRVAASNDIRAAEALAATATDPAHHAKLQNDCDAATAMISIDPRRSIPLLTKVLRYHEEKGWARVIPELYLRRGRMHLALGELNSAAADFESGIALVEKHRESIEPGEPRWGMLDSAEQLFDEAITVALRSGARPAFAYAERERARSLSDADTKPLDLTAIPHEALLVEYASLPDRLLVFAVDAESCDVREVAVSRTELASLAGQYAQALSTDNAQEARRTGARLHELLIAPFWNVIAKHREIAFITDATTSGIAFAALPGNADRMLIEDFLISASPSAYQYLRSRLREPRARTKILLVDSPANESMERLDAASAEADAVQREYRHVRRMRGAAATREAFIDESQRAGMIHFAGHGVTSSDSAALVFSPTADDSGRLDAKAISGLDLRNTDIVVLAACDTARGPVRSAEGVLSVTHAFLQAGARVVIATLWSIDDRDSAEFFPRLHSRLARGMPAAEALRATQLEWIRDTPKDRTAMWAAVQAAGY